LLHSFESLVIIGTLSRPPRHVGDLLERFDIPLRIFKEFINIAVQNLVKVIVCQATLAFSTLLLDLLLLGSCLSYFVIASGTHLLVSIVVAVGHMRITVSLMVEIV